MTATDTNQAAHAAARMLRHCCAKAIVRLNGSEPDIRTIARQLSQTAQLAEKELEDVPAERRQ